MTTRSLAIRLAVAALLTVVVLFGVFRVIERPVQGDTQTYTAMFTDANGLRAGDDVRLYGVQVGKVRDVELDGALARVHFTVTRGHPLFEGGKIAVRYQNLTGFRYLDIQQPDRPERPRDPETVFETADTIPAFDITTLFKGLQPVLAQLSPADINQFATSMLAVIQGDGTGIGPALDAVDKLSRHVSDRQAVVSTLVGNLAQISDHLGGKSGNTILLMTNLTNLFVNITDKLPGLVQFAVTIPPILKPLRSTLTTLGVSGDRDRDLDALLQNAFPDPHEAAVVFGRMPGLIQSMTAAVPPTGPDAAMTCSRGTAAAPEPLQLLISGQRITLCNR
ncbi:MlaD family protein [Nocardia sp. BMG51109]|uniref:MlaD family protein n=1 Tax=Nocardia sp. BMG51109 TaxID=1056816 RepID=UPI000463BB64|nr:MlaD family protein [Nocardia sp. BMG51109]